MVTNTANVNGHHDDEPDIKSTTLEHSLILFERCFLYSAFECTDAKLKKEAALFLKNINACANRSLRLVNLLDEFDYTKEVPKILKTSAKFEQFCYPDPVEIYGNLRKIKEVTIFQNVYEITMILLTKGRNRSLVESDLETIIEKILNAKAELRDLNNFIMFKLSHCKRLQKKKEMISETDSNIQDNLYPKSLSKQDDLYLSPDNTNNQENITNLNLVDEKSGETEVAINQSIIQQNTIKQETIEQKNFSIIYKNERRDVNFTAEENSEKDIEIEQQDVRKLSKSEKKKLKKQIIRQKLISNIIDNYSETTPIMIVR